MFYLVMFIAFALIAYGIAVAVKPNDYLPDCNMYLEHKRMAGVLMFIIGTIAYAFALLEL